MNAKILKDVEQENASLLDKVIGFEETISQQEATNDQLK